MVWIGDNEMYFDDVGLVLLIGHGAVLALTFIRLKTLIPNKFSTFAADPWKHTSHLDLTGRLKHKGIDVLKSQVFN